MAQAGSFSGCWAAGITYRAVINCTPSSSVQVFSKTWSIQTSSPGVGTGGVWEGVGVGVAGGVVSAGAAVQAHRKRASARTVGRMRMRMGDLLRKRRIYVKWYNPYFIIPKGRRKPGKANCKE